MVFFIRKRKGISPNNNLVGSYIYGTRGVSPRNMLVGAIFYDNEEPHIRSKTKYEKNSLTKYAKRLKRLFHIKEDTL
jgi:hypothetical protein